MKKITSVFILIALFLITACDQEQGLLNRTETFGEIEAVALQFVALPMSKVPDGTYQAIIANQQTQVLVKEGKAQWLLPMLENGDYTLRFDHADKSYQAVIHINTNPLLEHKLPLLVNLNSELNLGISEEEIKDLVANQQQELAQFILANKTRISSEQAKHNAQNMERIYAAYYSLAINESVTFNVASADYWNSSGVFATAGQVFQITANGTWTDWYIDTDANGYNSWQLALFTFLRRAKSEKWFKLIASVNKDKNYPVGKSATISPTESGPLNFYANDANGFYWNNYGSVSVTVTRVQ